MLRKPKTTYTLTKDEIKTILEDYIKKETGSKPTNIKFTHTTYNTGGYADNGVDVQEFSGAEIICE